MAGHSKWANIKHRKGAQDAARSKIFAKFAKEIMVAAAMGGGELASNSALRLAVQKAKAKSMPKKNIENAISKATGANASASAFKEYSFGANIGPISFLINALSDNVNRVTSNVQAYVKKFNGAVAGVSSVSYIFDRKGILEIDGNEQEEEKFMLMSLEAGAQDFEAQDDSFFIYTTTSDFSNVKSELEKQGVEDFKTAEITFVPNNEVIISKEKAEKILTFIETVEDDDDIQDIFHNLDAASLQ